MTDTFDDILAYYRANTPDDLQFERMKRFARDMDKQAFEVRELGFPEIIESADALAKIANMSVKAAAEIRENRN